MSVTRRVALSALCVVVAICTASAAELSRYREFDLGSSVEAVTAVTRTAERDLKTIHSRPALLQEVAWQPRYMSGAPVADRGSINEIVFSFVDDQLFRMTVVYDRSRTSGLTNADMIAALTDLYGAAIIPAKASADRPSGSPYSPSGSRPMRVSSFGAVIQRSVLLVITSLPLEAIARKAQTTALMLDVREAPAREAELARKACGRSAPGRGAGSNREQEGVQGPERKHSATSWPARRTRWRLTIVVCMSNSTMDAAPV
jgi:hypothetical protein